MEQAGGLSHRAQQVDPLDGRVWDVLVIGGGIVGAGVARDAAMRGLSVALVEQYDFAFGTSSRSSRLLHGGLRYLAQGRLGLVREASREKWVLSRIAPHLCQAMAFVFPTYAGTRWPRWELAIGVKLYDLLCGGRNFGPSSTLSRAEVLRYLPGVRPDRLTGAVRYFDALTNDARLVLDTLCSAAAHGATVANYVRLEEAVAEPAGWRCLARDMLADRAIRIQARAVVHATGPWAERLPQSSVRLRLTKGVHLVIQREDLPVPDAVVMTEGDRILFAIPWGERVILGTTDTDYQGSLDDVVADPEDVDYVLGVVNQCFPGARLGSRHVLSTWAGLRPLLADPRGRPSEISRRHQICMGQPGWFDVAGGKLTTYRLIAQQAVDRVVGYLGRQTLPCRTAQEPLVEAHRVAGLSTLLPPPVARDTVQRYCTEQWAVHVDDVMRRRTGWHYYLHTDRQRVAAQVAAWMAEALRWDQSQTQAELERYLRGPISHRA